MTTGPYVKVYQSIVDDPMFRKVYDDDAALATWLRMLLIADAMYPASAPMPKPTPAIELLLKVRLIRKCHGNRYTVRGLEAERERRSGNARNAAAVRWHSVGNAHAMPNKAEQNKAEQSIGANAPLTGSFMGFRQPARASLETVKAIEEAEWQPCSQCGIRRAAHRADHEFAA
jgi:hypothetical protein